MKLRDVVYTETAGDDLAWIYDTIAEAAGPVTASKYEQRIRRFCEKLQSGSERGGLRDDVRPGLRIVGFERRVTVAFVVEPTSVVILRIFYGGRNWERDLRPSPSKPSR